MVKNLLFFTVANSGYYKFVPIYIYFVLRANENSHVEICVESLGDFYSKHGRAMDWLGSHYGGGFTVRESNWFGKVIPNSIRFIETPVTKGFQYVYIGDVDIVVFDGDIMDRHLENMNNHAIPFSNIIRMNSASDKMPRLTGCHFAPFSVQYPVPDFSDLDYEKLNDERLLHELLRRKGYTIPIGLKYRPVHGIHVSPNRKAHDNDRPSWNLGNEIYNLKFMECIEDSKEFRDFYFTLNVDSKSYLLLIEALLTDQSEALIDAMRKHL
ncbi:hypothetical protein [Chromohalobacter israelensis]|uniref:hypothetical protein n=1 Tax=Chromohalobacter israelensis TaxID=141390 RepID=UPI0012EC8781|nr:hypothetical protein [Chromohalobacter israelensis]MDF9436051.1 hypothetical protein [Chromohalobacter israelensis]